MSSSQDFVESDAPYAEQAHQVSGAEDAAGMAPYPLYGIPAGMGTAEPAVVFYKRPWFCWSLGLSLGLAGGFFVGHFAARKGFSLGKKKAQ